MSKILIFIVQVKLGLVDVVCRERNRLDLRAGKQADSSSVGKGRIIHLIVSSDIISDPI